MSAIPERFGLMIDQRGVPSDSVRTRLMDRVRSDLPHGVSLRSAARVIPRDLLPDDAQIVASWQSIHDFEVLAETRHYVVHVEVGSWGTFVRIAAESVETAEEIGASMRTQLDPAKVGQINLMIWNGAHSGGSYSNRTLPALHWSDIARNYPPATRQRVATLVWRQPPSVDEARLILFHGEPGTGKTNAIRAVMTEWSPWCDVHMVTDPDRLFADARYLLEVIQQREGAPAAPTLTSAPGVSRWKLVIAEDADAYLCSTTRHDAGAALGRLLNTTDGLLAQSTRVLVLLTTNEPLRRLHPAITRPGRCLAEIEFMRFDAHGAGAWLDGDAAAPASATLAELYELLRAGTRPKPPSRSERTCEECTIE